MGPDRSISPRNSHCSMRVRTVKVSAGEMFVVPKDVENKPFAEGEVKLLLIELRGTVNTGEEGGERTAPIDAWI